MAGETFDDVANPEQFARAKLPLDWYAYPYPYGYPYYPYGYGYYPYSYRYRYWPYRWYLPLF